MAARYAARLDQVRWLDAALAVAPTGAALDELLTAAAPAVRAGLRALAYLRGRGITDAVLGPAASGWCGGDDLASLAHAHGWTNDELLMLGLLRMPRADDPAETWPTEHLAGRIVIPVIEHGRCPWVTGRLPYEPRPGSRHAEVSRPARPPQAPVRPGRRQRSGGGAPVEGALDWLVAVQWRLPPPVALDGLALQPADFRRLNRGATRPSAGSTGMGPGSRRSPATRVARSRAWARSSGAWALPSSPPAARRYSSPAWRSCPPAATWPGRRRSCSPVGRDRHAAQIAGSAPGTLIAAG